MNHPHLIFCDYCNESIPARELSAVARGASGLMCQRCQTDPRYQKDTWPGPSEETVDLVNVLHQRQRERHRLERRQRRDGKIVSPPKIERPITPRRLARDPRVTVMISTKNPGVAILLTILFGPFGMLYSTIRGAITMLLASVFISAVFWAAVFSFDSVGTTSPNALLGGLWVLIGLMVIIWIVSIAWAAKAANDYNRELLDQG